MSIVPQHLRAVQRAAADRLPLLHDTTHESNDTPCTAQHATLAADDSLTRSASSTTISLRTAALAAAYGPAALSPWV